MIYTSIFMLHERKLKVMTEGKIIKCASTQDMLVKAAQLSAEGIKTEFISRFELKIVEE